MFTWNIKGRNKGLFLGLSYFRRKELICFTRKIKRYPWWQQHNTSCFHSACPLSNLSHMIELGLLWAKLRNDVLCSSYQNRLGGGGVYNDRLNIGIQNGIRLSPLSFPPPTFNFLFTLILLQVSNIIREEKCKI